MKEFFKIHFDNGTYLYTFGVYDIIYNLYNNSKAITLEWEDTGSFICFDYLED